MQDAEAFGGIKSSASHDSVIDNRLQPQPTHQYPYPVRNVNAYSQHGQHPIQQSNYPEEYQYNRTKAPSYKRNHHHEKCNYGEIPAPPKTTKQSPVKPSSWSNNQRNRSKKGHWDSVDNYNYPLPYCAYPLNPPVSHDGYTNSKRLSAALQPGHPEKEDERSVNSHVQKTKRKIKMLGSAKQVLSALCFNKNLFGFLEVGFDKMRLFY